MTFRSIVVVLAWSSVTLLSVSLSGCGRAREDHTRRRILTWCVFLQRAESASGGGGLDLASQSSGAQLMLKELLETVVVDEEYPTTDAWGRELMLEVGEVEETGGGIIVRFRLYSRGRRVNSDRDDISEKLFLSSTQFIGRGKADS